MNEKTLSKAKDFEIIYKFLFNRVDYDKFKEFMERGLNRKLDDGYLNEKWNEFIRNVAGFAVSYKSFLIEVIDEIEKTGYEG